MTEAKTGLRKALARTGSGVVTLAEMQSDEIIANLSDDQKADLSAALAPAASAEEAPADPVEGQEEEGAAIEPEKQPEAAETAASAGDPRVKAVAAAVEGDDNCKGKADLALQMLADDDYAGLSASGIVKLLGKAPAPAAASAVDQETQERAAMQNALSGSKNSNIDPGAANAGKPAASDPWAKVITNLSNKG